MRGRDALRRERQQIRYYTRGMTKAQAERFQREVEETKRGMGLGGRDLLPASELQAIREEVFGGERG